MYEVDQRFFGSLSVFGRTFDIWDIVAAAVGALIGYTLQRGWLDSPKVSGGV